MNAAGRFRCNVAGNTTGEAELFKQPGHSFFVLANVRIHFAVGAFEIRMRHQRRTAVSWTNDVDHVLVIFFDDAIEMHAQHVEAW
jgi:hypothetical protein